MILQKCHRKWKRRVFFWRSYFNWPLSGQFRRNLGKNGVWSVLIWKTAPNEMHSFFLEVTFWVFFGQVGGNLGKISWHPQKFACSYTYDDNEWFLNCIIRKILTLVSLQPFHERATAVVFLALALTTYDLNSRQTFLEWDIPYLFYCKPRLIKLLS